MGNNMDANKNGFTLNLQIQKLVVWIVLISILYLVRPLFPVMFLTFILSYIGNTAVKFLHKRIPYRRVCLSAVYLVFILALIGIIYAVLPKIYDEASQLAKQHLHKDEIIRVVTTETASEKATIELAEARIGLDHEMGVAEHDTKTVTAGQTLVGDEIRKLLDRFGGRVMGKQGYETFKTSGAYTEVIIGGEHAVMEFVPKIVDKVSGLVNNIVTLVFHFFLAMIFSFLILWDLPGIQKGMSIFSQGPTGKLYSAIAPDVRSLAMMIGKAFEAQTGIGIVNAILTSIGFAFLGIPSIALLAMIVFFCSYIPVLGVFLSTIPAALLGIKVGGFMMIIWIVIMVLIVHAVEAYGLNPLIYGHHMSLHPVAVLVVLLIGEHLFGVWGLLLGVPVTAFVVNYVIKGEVIE